VSCSVIRRFSLPIWSNIDIYGSSLVSLPTAIAYDGIS
jgi:hypothetical protein